MVAVLVVLFAGAGAGLTVKVLSLDDAGQLPAAGIEYLTVTAVFEATLGGV